MKRLLIYCCRDTKDVDGEAKAASGLGDVYLQMGEFHKAIQYHQMDYDVSELDHGMDGKVKQNHIFIQIQSR